MGIAAAVERRLSRHHMTFDMVPHQLTGSSTATAQAAHVSGKRIAKAVVLEDARGLVMAVIPGNRHVNTKAINARLGRSLHMVPEHKLEAVFLDCEPGAVPPLGPVYGLETVVDDALEAYPEVYFEAGDHRSLVHMSSADFLKLLGPAPHGRFSEPID